MQIKPVENILAGEVTPLTMVELRALDPIRQPYQAMLLQPKGIIEGSEIRIGHADQAAGHAICHGFLLNAVEKHADLVVAPEYCVPWSVVEEIISGHLRPSEGAIWVLGCESITPEELETLARRVNTDGVGFFYHEPIDAGQKAQKQYIDPLLYVFWAKNAAGTSVLCFLVQFKTTPCRDYFDVEQRSLYVGQFVYSFNRGLNKIGLLTIICSDAFGFTNDLVDTYHTNCLIIHIQLNPKPAHNDYAAYRSRLFAVGSNNHVELLCVNWAHNVCEVKEDGSKEYWRNNTGSAWYVPFQKFNADDELIDRAHHSGVYYSLVANRWHTFFFNYESHILLLQKQKLLLFPDPQALLPKTCMTVMERWSWDGVNNLWVAGSVAVDGFTTLVGTYNALQAHLPRKVHESPLAVERAVEILIGPSGNVTSWYSVSEMPSMHVDIEESIRRVTVHQEVNPTSAGVVFRKGRMQRAQDAITLPDNNVPWPMSARDLENGFEFEWSANNPYRNVTPLTGNRGAATMVYLAEENDESVVERIHQKLSQGLIKHAIDSSFREGTDLNDAVVRALDRLCVVYRRGHQYRARGPEGLNLINNPSANSAVDIVGEHHD